jgi:hypothetical protein
VRNRHGVDGTDDLSRLFAEANRRAAEAGWGYREEKSFNAEAAGAAEKKAFSFEKKKGRFAPRSPRSLR